MLDVPLLHLCEVGVGQIVGVLESQGQRGHGDPVLGIVLDRHLPLERRILHQLIEGRDATGDLVRVVIKPVVPPNAGSM